MTFEEFIEYCNELTIDPMISLEETTVRQAVLSGDRDLIIEALENNF